MYKARKFQMFLTCLPRQLPRLKIKTHQFNYYFFNIYRKFHSRFHSEIKKTKKLWLSAGQVFSLYWLPHGLPAVCPGKLHQIKNNFFLGSVCIYTFALTLTLHIKVNCFSHQSKLFFKTSPCLKFQSLEVSRLFCVKQHRHDIETLK